MFFAFNIKWTKRSIYELIEIDCGFVISFCIVYLVKAQNHLIPSNAT